MKKMIAVVLMLVAWASLAHGQTTAQDGQSTRGVQQGVFIGGMLDADSTMRVIRSSTTGGLKISDEARDRDFIKLWDGVINNASLAAGAGDSSSAVALADVGAYRYLKLLIKCTPAGGANTTVRLAFQFRELANGATDSTSNYAEYNYVASNQGGALSAIDSSMTGHLATGSATVQWSGEYGLLINGNRSAPASGVAATAWSYPNGISIPLDSMFGRPARFNKLQIRVRNMNNNNPAVAIKVSVLGFAQ